jgi:hypothetical protein
MGTEAGQRDRDGEREKWSWEERGRARKTDRERDGHVGWGGLGLQDGGAQALSMLYITKDRLTYTWLHLINMCLSIYECSCKLPIYNDI